MLLGMKTPLLTVAVAAIGSLILLFERHTVWPAVLTVLAILALAAVATRPRTVIEPLLAQRRSPGIGIGTVRAVDSDHPESVHPDEARTFTIDVENVTGQVFTGRLRYRDGDAGIESLRPGSVLLVTFDPAAREQLCLADEMAAVCADFDRMLVDKGLLTYAQLDLIRYGVKTNAVVTGLRSTGLSREDHREVVLDLMVSRDGGGQFPAHETTLVPASSLPAVGPGSVVDVYYRRGDEAAIAICIPPN